MTMYFVMDMELSPVNVFWRSSTHLPMQKPSSEAFVLSIMDLTSDLKKIKYIFKIIL